MNLPFLDTNVTINQLVAIFNEIAVNHAQLNSFGYGQEYDIDAVTVENFPLLWVWAQPSKISNQSMRFVFRAHVMDLVNSQGIGAQQTEVQSDTINTLWDIVFLLRDYYDLQISFDITATPFTEAFNSRATGWFVDINIEVPQQYGVCDVPFKSCISGNTGYAGPYPYEPVGCGGGCGNLQSSSSILISGSGSQCDPQIPSLIISPSAGNNLTLLPDGVYVSGGTGGSTLADNGLTLNAGIIELGGLLIKDTSIDGAFNFLVGVTTPLADIILASSNFQVNANSISLLATGLGASFILNGAGLAIGVNTTINAPLKIADGTQGSGLVFTSNGAGVGSWQPIVIDSIEVINALGYTPYSDANPAGYITAGQVPVTSVFGRTGDIVATGGDYFTDQVVEDAGFLYFTEPRVLATILNGFATQTGAVLATDSVLTAIEKLAGNASASSITTNDGSLATSGNTDIRINSAHSNSWSVQQLFTTITASAFIQAGIGAPIEVYNTADMVTNFEKIRLRWNANVAEIKLIAGGTGTSRNMVIGAANTFMTFNEGTGLSGFWQLTRNSGAGGSAGLVVSGTYSNSSGDITSVLPTLVISETSTGGYTVYGAAITESTTGSGAKNLINLKVNGQNRFTVFNTGSVLIASGGTAVGTAPIKLTAGGLLASIETGAIEFDGSHFYGSVGATRYQLDQQSVTNVDGSLTIAANVASLNVAHANTWTGIQSLQAINLSGGTSTDMLKLINPTAATASINQTSPGINFSSSAFNGTSQVGAVRMYSNPFYLFANNIQPNICFDYSINGAAFIRAGQIAMSNGSMEFNGQSGIVFRTSGGISFSVITNGINSPLTNAVFSNAAAAMVVGGATPNASAVLTLIGTTRGFLPPVMTTVQKNAIATPAAGLIVYDSTLNKLCVKGLSGWETITSV